MPELLHLDNNSEQQALVPLLLSRPPGLGKGGTGPFWRPLSIEETSLQGKGEM